MNVTFVYRYLTLGGVEVVLRSRQEGLPAFGIRPTIWFLSDGPGRSLWPKGSLDVRVGGLSALSTHLASSQVDLLSVIDTPEVLELAAECQHVPRVVLEVHTPYPENRLYLRSEVTRVANMVIVPSEHQRRVVLKEMPHAPEVCVVPNPLGAGFAAPLVDLDNLQIPPIVAWVGRLDWLKDWRGFIRIAERVLRQVAHLEIWVVGSGASDEEAEFERRSSRGSMQGRLRWLRGVPPSAMPRVLDGVRASGGVLVSTSRGESFGMAVVEAMARGCAVVVPSLGPFPEFVEHGVTGRLYRRGDMRQAAREVAVFLQDADGRRSCGRGARQAILTRHAPEVALRQLADELERVVADGPDAVVQA